MEFICIFLKFQTEQNILQQEKAFDNFDINNAYIKSVYLSVIGGNEQKFIGASKRMFKDLLPNGNIISIIDNRFAKEGKTIGTKSENLISSDGGMLSASRIK